jgi:hypothetical protein
MPIYPKMERHCPFNFGLGITLVPVPLLQREAQKCLAVGILGLGVWRLGEPVEIAGTVGDWHGFAIASAPSHRIATFEVYVPTAWIGERESLAGGSRSYGRRCRLGLVSAGGWEIPSHISEARCGAPGKKRVARARWLWRPSLGSPWRGEISILFPRLIDRLERAVVDGQKL